MLTPRLPIDPNLWNWKVVVQFTRKEAAHINELEMRSFLSSFFVASPLQTRPLHDFSTCSIRKSA